MAASSSAASRWSRTRSRPGETTLDDLRAQMFGVGAELHRDFLGAEQRARGRLERARGGRARDRPVVRGVVGARAGRSRAASSRRSSRLAARAVRRVDRRRLPDAARRLRRPRRGRSRGRAARRAARAARAGEADRRQPRLPREPDARAWSPPPTRSPRTAPARTSTRGEPASRRDGSSRDDPRRARPAGDGRRVAADDHAARAARLEPRPVPPADGAERRGRARRCARVGPAAGAAVDRRAGALVEGGRHDRRRRGRRASARPSGSWTRPGRSGTRSSAVCGCRSTTRSPRRSRSRRRSSLADAGDATNGGAIGDSTELLRAVLRRRRARRAALDPRRGRRGGRDARRRRRDRRARPRRRRRRRLQRAHAGDRRASSGSSTATSSTRTRSTAATGPRPAPPRSSSIDGVDVVVHSLQRRRDRPGPVRDARRRPRELRRPAGEVAHQLQGRLRASHRPERRRRHAGPDVVQPRLAPVPPPPAPALPLRGRLARNRRRQLADRNPARARVDDAPDRVRDDGAEPVCGFSPGVREEVELAPGRARGSRRAARGRSPPVRRGR